MSLWVSLLKLKILSDPKFLCWYIARSPQIEYPVLPAFWEAEESSKADYDYFAARSLWIKSTEEHERDDNRPEDTLVLSN